MTSTMVRRCLTAAMALAAVATVVALAPMSLAEARGGNSPFAGTYDWNSGTNSEHSWAVTISNGGHVTGSLMSSPFYTKGSISGRVGADGSYSFTLSVTFLFDRDPLDEWDKPMQRTIRTTAAGNMALDAGGNIVGTADTGPSFAWLRQ